MRDPSTTPREPVVPPDQTPRRKRRPRRLRAAPRPPLTIKQILAWADDHHERTGRWPHRSDGPVRANRNETWYAIHSALSGGNRGLPGGTSLARLLSQHRGVRNQRALPLLTIEQILRWADAEHDRTGRWPTSNDGAVSANPDEDWRNIAAAFYNGSRGLPAGYSLAKLLAEHRGVRNQGNLPALSETQILAWADAWHRRTGRWPGPELRDSIPEAPGEKWNCIDGALRGGGRGLTGGDTLAKLLARERQVRNLQNLPSLTERQILRWARAHHARTGRWPSYYAGAVEDAPEESWPAINSALRDGGRGLPGGTTLARLLAERLGIRNKVSVPDLTEEQILKWADGHQRRNGAWPRVLSGPIVGAAGETWLAIDSALREGLRGLPGGDSLARLLERRRGVRNKAAAPRLTVRLILRWARRHHRETGRWPNQSSGPVRGAPGETWAAINRALEVGYRGLPGEDSLPRMLARHLRSS